MDDAFGCFLRGRAHETGIGTAENLDAARQHYAEACDGGELAACPALGDLYASGRGVEMDKARAIELFKQACTDTQVSGCTKLGVAYYFGDGVTEDPTVAQALWLRACDGGDTVACSNAAVLYYLGKGGPRDLDRARELAREACEGRYPDGCANLATIEVERERPEAALEALERALSLPGGEALEQPAMRALQLAAGADWEATARLLLDAYAATPEGFRSQWEWEHVQAYLAQTPRTRRLLPVIDILLEAKTEASVAQMKKALASMP